jgi:hypothetical protein
LWWLGLCPNHHKRGSLLRATGLLHHPASVPFRKFDEEVLRTLRGLRPHSLPLALDPERTRGALRRDWTPRPPTQPSVAERPSASFKTSPLPRLDSLLATLTRAGGGVRGGGGGRPRPFGMLPWCGREAARRDHQPQLVRELMTRDTRQPGPTFALWWGKKPGVAAKRTPGFRFSRGCGVRGL